MRPHPGGLAGGVIRELAENPNVHQPMSPGRELVADPGGRWAVYLGSGSGPHSATVQRVRVGDGEVEAALPEIRSFLRERGRGGAEWELGESCTPADLVARLLELGLRRDAEEPFATGMVLRGPLGGSAPPEVTTRRVASLEELVLAREIQRAAFCIGDEELGLEQTRADFAAEGVTGATFLGFVNGEAVSAAYASYTPLGLLLFGGATLPAFRGRGAYRALVAARAEEAAARGTPALVTHAGRMSRPILERLGFVPVARIDRLIDVLD
jgi:GNAT superfamily N-acetyltransferase